MADIHSFSTSSVAQALGVSVSTVKRWIDEGRLPARRTTGGHRRILLGDLQRLARSGNLPHANLNLLAEHARAGTIPQVPDLAEQLLQALRQADQAQVCFLLRSAYCAGTSLERLADEVVAPTMRQLGQQWQAGQIDVYQEHCGTQLCLCALHELRSLIESPLGDAPVALGGCPEFDHYLLATTLIALMLRDHGWNAINIGPNTPAASFRKAIRECKPGLFWLSASHLADPEVFLAQYHELYDEAARNEVAVAVGGQALKSTIRARMLYTFHGDGLVHLAAFAHRLHPPLELPRGRRSRTTSS